MMEEIEIRNDKNCNNCNIVVKENAKFCHGCGQKMASQLGLLNANFNSHLKSIFAYYFTSLGIIVLLFATDFQTNTNTALISDILFALITIGFVFNNYREIRPLFSFKNVHLKIIAVIILCEFVFAIGVTHFADFLNEEIFNVSNTRYYSLYLDSSSPIFFALLSVAVFPAIFEELGFRGFLFNHLTKITTVSSAIIVSSALFAVIHLSVIALLWILPLGLVFAYLRNKYQTLWYGIIGHFFYNGFIILYEFFQDGILF